ncbi:Hypothetical predicted protein, partial [Mytilus galloprovincialis]
MVDHMQVGFSTMDGGSHASWIFDDGWWITCRLDFRRWMVDHMQVGFSPMDGGSHADERSAEEIICLDMLKEEIMHSSNYIA